MATNNAWNSQDPAQVAKGGTGAATLTGVLTGNGTNAITANAVTQYGVLLGGASNAVGSTAVGTAGQVLTSNGAGANPTYQAGGTGSGWVLLSTATASNSATIEFTSNINSTYNLYAVEYYKVYPANSAATMLCRTSANNGGSWASTLADYIDAAGITTSMEVSGAMHNTSSTTAFGILYFIDPSNVTTTKMMLSINGMCHYAVSQQRFNRSGGIRDNTAVVNGIQFLMSSGNITAGIFRLYGVLT